MEMKTCNKCDKNHNYLHPDLCENCCTYIKSIISSEISTYRCSRHNTCTFDNNYNFPCVCGIDPIIFDQSTINFFNN